MIDQLMEFLNFDDLDLSFDADHHELDSCMPSLMEDSYTSDDTRNHEDIDDTEVAPMCERQKMEEDGEEDSPTEVGWDDFLSNLGKTKTTEKSPIGDIHWDPIVAFPHSHDCHDLDASYRTSRDFNGARFLFRDTAAATTTTNTSILSPPSNDRFCQDIHWVPPRMVLPQHDTTTEATSSTISVLQPSQTVPSSSSSSYSVSSLQEEYERSRQKLVLSMMRSQESRRYVRQHWQHSTSSSQHRVRDLRDEMITTLSSTKFL